MSTVIKVDNISKKYLVTHQQREPYSALRDVVAEKLKRTAIRLFTGSLLEDNTSCEEFWALSHVSFEVKHGDRLAIVGKNGAGKSTLLKILSRITEPTAGRISIKGRIASLLEVGTGFHPELTGRENIYLNGAVLGMARKEISRKFDEIVFFSEVERFLDMPVKHYSTGMHARLAFAVAAHLESEILIVDEVLAVGDADFQNKCMKKMEQASKSEGTTVLLVSHNMTAITSLCSSAILLHRGTIQASGDTDTITQLYCRNGIEDSGEFLVGPARQDEKVVVEKVTLYDAKGSISSIFEFGHDISIHVELNAAQQFEKPYLWIAIKSAKGPVANASGLIDGFRTSRLKTGKNIVKCTFHKLPFMPGRYIIHMGVRDNDAKTLLTDTKDVASFIVAPKLSGRGLNDGVIESIASDSVSPLIPYTWEFNDGTTYSFKIDNYV